MLYLAPLNRLSNFVYRHFLLERGADFVFSELLLPKDFEKGIVNDKFKLISGDLPHTIFQLGVSTEKELEQGVSFLREHFPNLKEINLNMGCPQSSMQKTKFCGFFLFL